MLLSMRNQHPLATWAREQARRLFYLSLSLKIKLRNLESSSSSVFDRSLCGRGIQCIDDEDEDDSHPEAKTGAFVYSRATTPANAERRTPNAERRTLILPAHLHACGNRVRGLVAA